eukprot:3557667-Pyramimonas_sp.AAC.1
MLPSSTPLRQGAYVDHFALLRLAIEGVSPPGAFPDKRADLAARDNDYLATEKSLYAHLLA